MTPTKRYNVTCDLKAQANSATGRQLGIVVSAMGYKQAWIDARNVCRQGGTVELIEPVDGSTDFELPPGQYTVRKIFVQATPKAPKVQPLTAAKLIEVAKERGMSHKVIARLEEIVMDLETAPPADTSAPADADPAPAEEPVEPTAAVA